MFKPPKFIEPRNIEIIRIQLPPVILYYVSYHNWKPLLRVLHAFKGLLNIFKLSLLWISEYYWNPPNALNPDLLKSSECDDYSWHRTIFSHATK
jgi:hypothetical protein